MKPSSAFTAILTGVLITGFGTLALGAGDSSGEHRARIETLYMHFSRFAKGIRPGKRVNQGDVIGYVGMTGLATGPHLHYSVTDNGAWLDPLKLKSITPDPLRGASLDQFRAGVVRFTPKLAAAVPQVAELAAKRRALF